MARLDDAGVTAATIERVYVRRGFVFVDFYAGAMFRREVVIVFIVPKAAKEASHCWVAVCVKALKGKARETARSARTIEQMKTGLVPK